MSSHEAPLGSADERSSGSKGVPMRPISRPMILLQVAVELEAGLEMVAYTCVVPGRVHQMA